VVEEDDDLRTISWKVPKVVAKRKRRTRKSKN